MGTVVSVNVATPRPIAAKSGRTGIDKRSASGPVRVSAPGPGGSGLVGDTIVDVEHHGGPEQAVYAYGLADLDWWSSELGRPLAPGVFGENLTVDGFDVNAARLGERWYVGAECVLEVTCPRIPCKTFAVWIDTDEWLTRFRVAARPGPYLRVIESGSVAAGDPIRVERPDHDVTVALTFQAITTRPELVRRLAEAGDHLIPELRELLA